MVTRDAEAMQFLVFQPLTREHSGYNDSTDIEDVFKKHRKFRHPANLYFEYFHSCLEKWLRFPKQAKKNFNKRLVIDSITAVAMALRNTSSQTILKKCFH